MTTYVCRHHVGAILWIIAGIVLVSLLINSGIIISNPIYEPPFDLPFDEFKKLDDKYFNYQWNVFQFVFLFVVFCVVNMIGMYFSNERYHWYGLKECSR